MTITVRDIDPQDKTQWLKLWRGYQAFYQVDLSADGERLWAVLMDPPEVGPYCLVAEDESGNLLGLAQFLYHATTWSALPRCYLNDLYTDPESRGGGVGRALIEAVYASADRHGSSQVYWLTQEFNSQARILYDRVASCTPFIKYAR
jgi:GNAT superfamily N-acetyltransferase